MLESIVKDQTIDRKLVQDPIAKFITIGADCHDRFGATLRHQKWLVACLVRSDQ